MEFESGERGGVVGPLPERTHLEEDYARGYLAQKGQGEEKIARPGRVGGWEEGPPGDCPTLTHQTIAQCLHVASGKSNILPQIPCKKKKKNAFGGPVKRSHLWNLVLDFASKFGWVSNCKLIYKHCDFRDGPDLFTMRFPVSHTAWQRSISVSTNLD